MQASNRSASRALQRAHPRLKGVLTWRLQTKYHERLTQAHKHLRELNDDVAILTAQYDAFVRTRQAAMHSYVGYDLPINRLRARVGEALERRESLMARQGQLIETVAINELKARGQRLEAHRPRRASRSRTATTAPRRRRPAEGSEMRRSHLALIVAPALVFAACAENPDKRTLASLHEVPAETATCTCRSRRASTRRCRATSASWRRRRRPR